ncbi:hypothetical protein T484DRAFT_3649930 [Baffinella frigidus]|nr:hypothetical protein T484DRAFT_3649930 [Cryptophyta sp. CCMP2293]
MTLDYLKHLFGEGGIFEDAKDELGKRVVVVCDGHGSHITVEALTYLRSRGGVLQLRVPHSSGETQGEDTSIFNVLKRALRPARAAALLAKTFSKGWYATPRPDGKKWRNSLSNEDVMYIIFKPWVDAFSKENVLTGFRVTGISPCTRRPQFKIALQEMRARNTVAKAERHDVAIDMRESVVVPSEGPFVTPDFSKSDGRYNSAKGWYMGPATAPEFYQLAVEARNKTNASAKKKSDSAAAKQLKGAEKHHAALALLKEVEHYLASRMAGAQVGGQPVLEESDFMGRNLKAAHVWGILTAHNVKVKTSGGYKQHIPQVNHLMLNGDVPQHPPGGEGESGEEGEGGESGGEGEGEDVSMF